MHLAGCRFCVCVCVRVLLNMQNQIRHLGESRCGVRAESGFLGDHFWSQQADGERSLNFISLANSIPCLGREECGGGGCAVGGRGRWWGQEWKGEGENKPMGGELSNPLDLGRGGYRIKKTRNNKKGSQREKNKMLPIFS